MLGLVIKSPWIDLILSQQKTWEIRGSKTNVRGSIALIKSGSGKIYGTCEVVDCIGPLSLDELRANASMLPQFTWVWLRSDHDLIIGDDPLCSWSRRLKHIEYGLAHPDCEVTMPLARNLCLRMQHEEVRDPDAVVECDYGSRCIYNNRQVLSAKRKVYGPSRQILQEAQRLKEIAAGRCPLPKGG